MSFRACTLVCITIVVAALTPRAADAQFNSSMMRMLAAGASGNAISSAGTESIKVRPDRLRMYVQVTGQGKTLKDALANLKKQHQAAVPRLEALGAKKGSTSLGTPSVAAQSESDQLNMLVRARMRAGISTEEKKKGPKVYKVNATLKAEWPLPSEKPDELLLFVDNLTEQIGKIDLSGKKDAKKLSPEEQELLEEMEGDSSSNYSSSDDEVKPGKPYFVYVGNVSKDQIDKAMRKAFVEAKQNGERLARAAGIKLGPLAGLSGGGMGASNNSVFSDFSGSYEMRNYFRQMMQGQETETNENEAVSSTPGPISYQVAVMVTFKIGK